MPQGRAAEPDSKSAFLYPFSLQKTEDKGRVGCTETTRLAASLLSAIKQGQSSRSEPGGDIGQQRNPLFGSYTAVELQEQEEKPSA